MTFFAIMTQSRRPESTMIKLDPGTCALACPSGYQGIRRGDNCNRNVPNVFTIVGLFITDPHPACCAASAGGKQPND